MSEGLTLKDLDNLVRSTNNLLSSLQRSFDKGLKMLPVSDEDSWDNSSLFRDCFIHSVLDIETNSIISNDQSRFKEVLKKRWEDADNIREVTKKI